MCSPEYLDKRHKDVVNLITQTVKLAVEGTASDCGACSIGQVTEIKVMLELLQILSVLLGTIISRTDKVGGDAAELKAVAIVGGLLHEQIGDEYIGPFPAQMFDPNMN